MLTTLTQTLLRKSNKQIEYLRIVNGDKESDFLVNDNDRGLQNIK